MHVGILKRKQRKAPLNKGTNVAASLEDGGFLELVKKKSLLNVVVFMLPQMMGEVHLSDAWRA